MPPLANWKNPAEHTTVPRLAMRAGLAAALLALPTSAGDLMWPDYRGPGHDGQAPDGDLPLTWGEEQSITWKAAIPGRGWSSPVVGDDAIWLTTATPDGRQLFLMSLSLESGEQEHERLVFEIENPQSMRNKMNGYASPSPALEDGRIYVHFGTAGTACFDTQSGDMLWQRQDINCEHLEGPGSSPIIVGDHLIFNVDGADVQFVIALDKATGKTAWKTERSTDLEDLVPDLRKAYATPIVVATESGASELISTGAGATMGYDPATGEERWRIDHPMAFSMSARPVTGAGLIFINTGYMRPQMFAIRSGGKGNVTESHVEWVSRKRVPEMSSAVFANEHLFFANDAGIATCLNAKTGEVLWQERIGGANSASPLHHKGRIYFFDRDGQTTVIAAKPEFEVLAENQLDAGFFASPAVAGNSLILRTTEHLYRVQ